MFITVSSMGSNVGVNDVGSNSRDEEERGLGGEDRTPQGRSSQMSKHFENDEKHEVTVASHGGGLKLNVG